MEDIAGEVEKDWKCNFFLTLRTKKKKELVKLFDFFLGKLSNVTGISL